MAGGAFPVSLFSGRNVLRLENGGFCPNMLIENAVTVQKTFIACSCILSLISEIGADGHNSVRKTNHEIQTRCHSLRLQWRSLRALRITLINRWETFYTNATLNRHSGRSVVKRNDGPEGVLADDVLMDPAAHLAAVTVMFRREDGYDADTQNWLWAKYLPDGTLDKYPKGMQLAGRVAKGADAGCIACHGTADGDDYLFTSNGVK